MIFDYDKGGLHAPSIDTMAKSLKLAWIPRLLAVEENSEDSWKAIPNNLLHKYGRLNFLLRCNYNKKFLFFHIKKFLARINLPQFYKEILQHFLELKISPPYSITKTYCRTDALSSTEIGLKRAYPRSPRRRWLCFLFISVNIQFSFKSPSLFRWDSQRIHFNFLNPQEILTKLQIIKDCHLHGIKFAK